MTYPPECGSNFFENNFVHSGWFCFTPVHCDGAIIWKNFLMLFTSILRLQIIISYLDPFVRASMTLHCGKCTKSMKYSLKFLLSVSEWLTDWPTDWLTDWTRSYWMSREIDSAVLILQRKKSQLTHDNNKYNLIKNIFPYAFSKTNIKNNAVTSADSFGLQHINRQLKYYATSASMHIIIIIIIIIIIVYFAQCSTI